MAFLMVGFLGDEEVTVSWDGSSTADNEEALAQYERTCTRLNGLDVGFPTVGSDHDYDHTEGAAMAVWQMVLNRARLLSGPDWATGRATP